MNHFLSKVAAFPKKYKIITGILIALFLLVGWWSWIFLSPKPLGDKLEYLGKTNHGCWIGFCDSPSGSMYYYGTNMTPGDMKGYFKDAAYAPIENFAFEHARFTIPEGDFTFTYESKKDSPFVTDKKYIVTLPSSAYDFAKEYRYKQ